jgi:group I intron endonuclease
MWGFIYAYTIKNKKYIGQAINLKDRMKKHFKETANPYFHNSLRKYFKPGDFRILEAHYDTPEKLKILLDNREIFWIDKLNTYDPKQKTGWNLTKGGNGQLGWVPNEKTRKKMSDIKIGKPTWSKGQKFTTKHKENISKNHANVANENNPRAKSVILISPNNEKYQLECYAPFCKKNKLSPASICFVLQGKQKHHKGWTGNYINAR